MDLYEVCIGYVVGDVLISIIMYVRGYRWVKVHR